MIIAQTICSAMLAVPSWALTKYLVALIERLHFALTILDTFSLFDTSSPILNFLKHHVLKQRHSCLPCFPLGTSTSETSPKRSKDPGAVLGSKEHRLDIKPSKRMVGANGTTCRSFLVGWQPQRKFVHEWPWRPTRTYCTTTPPRIKNSIPKFLPCHWSLCCKWRCRPASLSHAMVFPGTRLFYPRLGVSTNGMQASSFPEHLKSSRIPFQATSSKNHALYHPIFGKPTALESYDKCCPRWGNIMDSTWKNLRN